MNINYLLSVKLVGTFLRFLNGDIYSEWISGFFVEVSTILSIKLYRVGVISVLFRVILLSLISLAVIEWLESLWSKF